MCLACAPASAGGASDDLLFVLSRALYPVQFLAYCWREVEADPVLRDIGFAWQTRNGGLLANLEARGRLAEIEPAARRAADEATLAEIKQAVAERPEGADYCMAIARLIDAGSFDIDRRQDLEDPLMRLFAAQ